MSGTQRLIVVAMIFLLVLSSATLNHDGVEPVEIQANTQFQLSQSRVIVFDYSHGQEINSNETDDLVLKSSLEALGYTIIWAKGGLNSSILSGAEGLIIGSLYGDTNRFLSSEITAIQDWFGEGEKFMWVGCDSDYAFPPHMGQFINDNMSAILESVGSHVYPEPTHVFDDLVHAGFPYRPIANTMTNEPLVAPAVDSIHWVMLHSPTLLYGSASATPGVGVSPVDLISIRPAYAYPLFYYSPSSYIADSDLIEPYAHLDGEEGPFVGATIETNVGASRNSTLVVSGASPYGGYSMHFEMGFDYDGAEFVVQTIDFGMEFDTPLIGGEYTTPTTSTESPSITTPPPLDPGDSLFFRAVLIIGIFFEIMIIIVILSRRMNKPVYEYGM
jgi:hypothetical protein